MIWISSHCGIEGTDQANEQAKLGQQGPAQKQCKSSIEFSDARNQLRTKMSIPRRLSHYYDHHIRIRTIRAQVLMGDQHCRLTRCQYQICVHHLIILQAHSVHLEYLLEAEVHPVQFVLRRISDTPRTSSLHVKSTCFGVQSRIRIC